MKKEDKFKKEHKHKVYKRSRGGFLLNKNGVPINCVGANALQGVNRHKGI